MKDILYIVGSGSKFDNIELRWSLRSVEKYGRNVGRIVVAGVIPDFLSDEVVKVPVEQRSWLYAKNNMANVVAAIERGAVDGDFLLSADDHFYMRETDFDAFPVYHCGALPFHVEPECRNKEYFMGLVFSRWLLGMCGMPTYNTSCHNNIPVSADSIRECHRIMAASRDPEYRMNPWALLGNMYLHRHPDEKPVHRNDIKLENPLGSTGEVKRAIGDAAFFSVGDAATASAPFRKYMMHEFGKPCRWEKEGVSGNG